MALEGSLGVGVAGMGLGLYISRRIVEMHGGSIQIEAPADGGARVTVQLPVGATRERVRNIREAARA